jgi:hypothetical protein
MINISKNMPFSGRKRETTMRQGDGSDLPGVNGPRKADIGIIYVAPSDDRQSVLTAIHTQDKLGRKQVVIVLPEENKAFQRPTDFEGLKNMRRDLKAQLVFIASSGPGPAEFARQRRFPVYSSLESFARSLQDFNRPNGGSKKGWSLPWQKSAATPPAAPGKAEVIQPLPNIPAVSSNQAGSEDDDTTVHQDTHAGINPVLAGAAGAAAVLGMEALTSHGNNPPTSNDPNDWDRLPPPNTAGPASDTVLSEDTPTQANTAVPSFSSTDAENRPEPKIIELSGQRGRSTGKLPLPVIAPVAAVQPHIPPAPASTTTRQRNSGKMAAVGAASTAAGVATMGRTARGGVVVPPARGTPIGTGGSGPGGPPRRPSLRWWLAIGALIVLTVSVCSLIAYADPAVLGPLKGLVPGITPSATVTITPASSDVSNTFEIFGVTGTPDPSQRQVQARQLSSTSPTQSKTVNATGVMQTSGTPAKGTLTFYNSAFVDQQVNAGTDFVLANGVHIITDRNVDIPKAIGTPPNIHTGVASVSAHAGSIGPGGNIAPLTINHACCSADSSIFARNLTAFTGGQDPQNFTIVSQSDIDGAAKQLENTLTPEVQKSVKGQIHPNEQLVNSLQCTPNVTSDHNAGDRATNVKVTVKVTCSGEVYDQQAAQLIASNLLKQQAAKIPGPGYALVGNLITKVTQVMVTDPKKGTLLLQVKAKGIWVFQFSDAQKQALANLIAGKSKQNAQTLLLNQMVMDHKVIAKADIVLSGGDGNTLPMDPTQITIVVQSVPGLPGPATPTTGPGSPGVPTNTPVSPTPTSTSSVGKG